MNVEVTNQYVVAEPYNMHSGMLCLVVSLCVVSSDNLGSSFNSFTTVPVLKWSTNSLRCMIQVRHLLSSIGAFLQKSSYVSVESHDLAYCLVLGSNSSVL